MTLDEIVDEFRECNYAHFDYFYNETKKGVFFSICAIINDNDVIDDLMQDTYVKFLENINKYQSKTNIKAFLSRISHNIAINYYNKEKKMVHDEEIFDYIPEETNKTPYSEIRVVEMLKCLDDISREIVIQHVINELKFKDIAKIVDKPLGTVLWLYNKAMKELKRKVGGEDE